MKKYSKLGGKKGKPAYRTPSHFKYRQSLKSKFNNKSKNKQKIK